MGKQGPPHMQGQPPMQQGQCASWHMYFYIQSFVVCPDSITLWDKTYLSLRMYFEHAISFLLTSWCMQLLSAILCTCVDHLTVISLPFFAMKCYRLWMCF
jgi:hypothetical protein